jgi:hypothetical protein
MMVSALMVPPAYFFTEARTISRSAGPPTSPRVPKKARSGLRKDATPGVSTSSPKKSRTAGHVREVEERRGAHIGRERFVGQAYQIVAAARLYEARRLRH